MDTLAHALYGGVVTHKRKDLFWWGMLFGALPDLSVSVYSLSTNGLAGILWLLGPGNDNLSDNLYNFYYLTHSFITVIFLYFVLRVVNKNFAFLAIPYGLHILFDIPLHCSRFSTRFLYPISNIHICGFSYHDHKWLWVINYVILGVIYLFIVLKRKNKKQLKFSKE